MATAIPYRILLSILAGIFALRVAAQFLVQSEPASLLPPFDLWHTATMPYEALLSSQLVILVAMGAVIIAAPFERARPRIGITLIGLGWGYVGVLAARLVIGTMNFIQHGWFDGAVPTAFHLLLAAFVLILGSALRGSRAPPRPRAARYLAYPVLMVGGFALFTWLRETGAPLLFSSYIAVLIAGFGVLMHETFLPARED